MTADFFAPADMRKMATAAPAVLSAPYGGTAYGQTALSAELHEVANAPAGQRNNRLNQAAFSLGQLVVAGHLEELEVVESLTVAGRANGLDLSEITATVRSGMRGAAVKPRAAVPDPAAASSGLILPAAFIPAPAAQLDDQPDLAEPAELVTWARVDLTSYLDGTHVAPEPALMPRTDGVRLLYAGLTHSLHGESESGKSWVAQAEAARCLQAGERVLYVDFESDAASLVGRLLLLGCTPEQVGELFDYRQPEASPSSAHEFEAWAQMLSSSCTLAVIDGVTDAMGLFGAHSMDNDEIATWSRRFPRQLASRTGAAVVMIDHVTKNAETRGRFAIGGQAKMAGLTGAGYVVDVVSGLGKGMKGVLTLRVAKDRPGAVRGQAGPMRRSDRTQEAARFVLDSTGDQLVATVEPWTGHDGSRQEFRPAHLMELASRFIEDNPGAGKNAVTENVPGRNEYRRIAVDLLAEEGYIRRENHGQMVKHYPVKPFREFMEHRLDEVDNGD